MKPKLTFLFQLLIAGLAILVALLLTVWFFMRIQTANTTLAGDWIVIRPGVDHWNLSYGLDSRLQITPWSAVLLLPLGPIPVNAGWGVVAFVTLAVLSLSVPREEISERKWIAGVLMLTLSFLAVRTIADGNVEFLTLCGLLFLEWGLLGKNPVLFALGILLTVTKVQEAWILVLGLPFLAGREWNSRRWLITVGVLALVVVPSLLWKGRDWLLLIVSIPERANIMNSSLLTTAERLGGSVGLAFLFWAVLFLLTAFITVKFCRGYSREAVAFLLSASLLLAPYAAGNNVLVVYAIGAVPLLLARRWEGAVLVGLINLPYFFVPFHDLMYWWSAPYWTLVLLISWVFLALRMRAARRIMDGGTRPSLAYR